MAARTPFAVGACALACLLPTAALADDPSAAAYFRPAHPIAFLSLSAGAGGYGAGSTSSGQGGYGGARGTVAARGDLEALTPLWLSVVGRTFGLSPAESELDVSVGYELRRHWVDVAGERHQREQALVRFLVGAEEIRYADSAETPTSSTTRVLRTGVDWVLSGEEGVKGVNVWRAHALGLWDTARSGPGVEAETLGGLSLSPRVLDEAFLGVRVGYLPSTGGFFIFEVGAAWEPR